MQLRSRVSWVGQDSSGFSLEYPSVALHALSRDLQAFPEECLYLMIDGDLGEEQEPNENGEDEERPASEIRFVPEDKSHLEAMYRAMTECQALHPDPAQPGDSDEDDGCYEDADEEEEGAEYDVRAAEQQRGCQQLDSGAGNGDWGSEGADEPMDLGQFQDAEPDH
ncbi:hypothetical protein HPB48_001958 [Haemaphysalis longicornis]|uniref:Methylosome subunit pICln n=1 Tax=Haemaphysalis longicornis TaxID=44386 RepID=A0A9J6G5W4_HAELO|nr:hypothetical protein HPB48_001958 [Haemaphysalis longicornis]